MASTARQLGFLDLFFEQTLGHCAFRNNYCWLVFLYLVWEHHSGFDFDTHHLLKGLCHCVGKVLSPGLGRTPLLSWYVIWGDDGDQFLNNFSHSSFNFSSALIVCPDDRGPCICENLRSILPWILTRCVQGLLSLPLGTSHKFLRVRKYVTSIGFPEACLVFLII